MCMCLERRTQTTKSLFSFCFHVTEHILSLFPLSPSDNLVKRLNELEGIEFMYQGISQHVRQLAKAFVDLCHMYKEFGGIFSSIGVREPQPEASLTFTKFGEMHRSIEKSGIQMLKNIKIMLSDMNTFVSKAVPDTRLTIKKYADVKFEYLVRMILSFFLIHFSIPS